MVYEPWETDKLPTKFISGYTLAPRGETKLYNGYPIVNPLSDRPKICLLYPCDTMPLPQKLDKVQQFILTASGAVFNSPGGEDNPHSINNVQNAVIDNGSRTAVTGPAATASTTAAETDMSEASMKETTTTETAQGRLGRLAAAVVKELRSGVDIGSVAAARAQAIRRYLLGDKEEFTCGQQVEDVLSDCGNTMKAVARMLEHRSA